ncbi:hypothetical protein MLD38_017259 [Melastoma candidum]|uniref:Uncharacterized protein n=1 Tax=Melastoma candidum TaxID=119954 RepID=A0ACB9QR87_9MYRT|nr:hypothetical protein MLD38_017259 [Melastoma candidum]
MANGSDAEDFVVKSQVRPGLKREFAFALKAQSELSGTLGRTRGARRTRSGSLVDGRTTKTTRVGSPDRKGGKRLKLSSPDPDVDVETVVGSNAVADGVVSEDEAKSDIVNGEDTGSGCLGNGESGKSAENGSNGKKGIHKVSVDMEDCGVVEEVLADVAGSVENGNANIGDNACLNGVEENNGGLKACHKMEVVLALNSLSEKRKVAPAKEDEVASSSEGVVVVPIPVAEVSSQKLVKRFTRSALTSKDNLVNLDRVDEIRCVNIDGRKLEPSGAPLKLGIKMSKKIGLKRPFVSLHDFLESGLLEGYHVTYYRYSKGTRQKEKGLEGIIRGSGVSCFCASCKPTNNVVAPALFELHAGSSNKRPAGYIYLDNGRTLRDVMNAVKHSSVNTIEQAVRAVIGCDILNTCSSCLSCRGPKPKVGFGNAKLLCSRCLESETSPVTVTAKGTRLTESVELEPVMKSFAKSAASALPIEAGPILKFTANTVDSTLPIVEPFTEALESTLPIVVKTESTLSAELTNSHAVSKITGKLTRKDLRLHRLVFEEDVLPDGTEVAYYARGQKMLVGYKKGFGIICSCCDSEVSPSQFEAHAGWATRRKPYLHIYTSNGVSLHELAVNLNEKRSISSKESDDVCSVCLDGGDLLCCDTCPRTYHLECIQLRTLPQGSWSCRYCMNLRQQEKFVNIDSLAAGRVAGADPIEQITKRCIRIVTPPATEIGGCALCRSHGFTRSGFGPKTVIICDQCEKEFHVGCLRDHGMADLKELPKGDWFCGTDCDGINRALKRLVAHGEEKLPDSLLDVVRKKRLERDAQSSSDVEIKWRILNSKMDSSDESRQLLSHSIKIFRDRFAPIAESAAKRDLIPAMVYGKSYKGQEFGGMFCIILIVNQAIVSAGLLRIFGDKMAELPLVATMTDCQGQGYFQSLFSCIEGLLGSLNVKDLVLPAAEEAESIWINRFGFGKMAKEEAKELRNKHPLMIFEGTTVLKKAVPVISDSSTRELKP